MAVQQKHMIGSKSSTGDLEVAYCHPKAMLELNKSVLKSLAAVAVAELFHILAHTLDSPLAMQDACCTLILRAVVKLAMQPSLVR